MKREWRKVCYLKFFGVYNMFSFLFCFLSLLALYFLLAHSSILLFSQFGLYVIKKISLFWK